MVGQISQSAGLPGTTINVEKLFKNMPHRLATFRQPTEEANRIADLLVVFFS
jgi:DNA mismatch repair ATPase MutL